MDRFKFSWTTMLSLALIAVLLVMAIYPGKSTFAGAHTMYLIRNDSGYGDTYFCWKCHSSQVVNITSNGTSKAHNSTTCICHGYYPNYTVLSGPYGVFTPKVIKLDHNLTTNIYCTNCHADYNESESTGSIGIYYNGTFVQKTENQSAHYMYLNGSNSSSFVDVYNRSWRYFNRSFGTPS